MLNGRSGVVRRRDSPPAMAPTLPAAPLSVRPTASALLRSVVIATRGFRADSAIALTARLAGVGSSPAAQPSCTRWRGPGSTSSSTWPRSTVEMPSMRIWWDFESTATRPPSRPSTK